MLLPTPHCGLKAGLTPAQADLSTLAELASWADRLTVLRAGRDAACWLSVTDHPGPGPLKSLWLTPPTLTPAATSSPRPWLVPPQRHSLPLSALPAPGVALIRREPGASV